MVGKRSIERRRLLKAAGAGMLGTSLPTTAGSATTGETDSVSATTDVVDAPSVTTSAAEEFVEHKSVTVDWDAETIRYRFEYDLPSELTEFELHLQTGPFEFRQVEDATSFKHEDVAPWSDEFVWTGADDPRIVFEDDFGSTAFDESTNVYRADEEIFSRPPGTYWWSSDATPEFDRRPYSFDGDGIARPGVFYTGEHETTRRTVEDVELALVVPEAITTDVDLEQAFAAFEFCEAYIGGTNTEFPEKTAFIVPSGRLSRNAPLGQELSGGFWVKESAWEFDSVDNTPVHEYAHTCLGNFGPNRLYWLTEASAEYYGYLCSLNAGISDFDEFYDAATISSVYTARLTDTETMRETLADYKKGAHVLAALDAEIQRTTDGRKQLLDCFLEKYFRSHASFKTTVALVANDQSLRDWVDQYVDGEEAPEIPDDDTYFTTEKTHFDISNLSSISGANNRVVPVTVDVRNKGSESGTETVEFRVDGTVQETRTVELDRFSMQELTFELDSAEYEGGEHTLEVSVGEYTERTTFTVQGTAEFELHSLNLEPGEPAPGELVTVTAEIENTGDRFDQVTIGFRLVDGTGTEYATNDDIFQLGGGVTDSFTLDRIDTTDLDPGEYTLVVSLEGTQTERTLQILSPAEFEIASFEIEATELAQGDPFAATAELENVGGKTESVPIELALESSAGNEQTVAERTAELPGQESETVSFEGIETGDLEPGRYTVRLRVGDSERETSLTVVENAETTDETDTRATGEADTEEPTETDDDDSDGSGPGFGVVSALAGLGGAGYLLKGRLSTRSVDDEQRD